MNAISIKKWLRAYCIVTVLISFVVLSLTLSGCGGGGGSGTAVGEDPGFIMTGKIQLADGSAISGATVKLYKTSYTVYTIDGFYTTRDSNGAESVFLDPAGSVTTISAADGSYAFKGLASGNYTIKPTSGTHVFKWALIPTRDSIGVVTITDSGTVYVYNPDGTGNKISVSGNIIYNIGTPFTLTSKTLANLDFEGSVPGGT